MMRIKKLFHLGLGSAAGALCISLSCLLCQYAQAADAPGVSGGHVSRGLPCTACHKAENSKELKDGSDYGVCATCHGDYSNMIEKTKDKTASRGEEQPNPHAQHDGALPCTECHKGHKESVNYCAQCHSFSYKVP